jgi:Pilus formation protein N terminal region
MSVVSEGFGRNGRHVLLVAAWILAVALPAAAQNRNSGNRVVTVTVDQAQVMKLPSGVATLVVGNPLIADVSIQSGGIVVVTGKGYGTTNLLAVDRSGAVLEEKTIRVQGARDSVVVYRGVERESYSCAPICERRITLGDSATFFAANLSSLSSFNALVSSDQKK